ncbi:hypothetical protein CN198_13985 [Sinorhizobium meliloti]|uniref:hypothetical protein n=1 Tax=Rhizobium meliloti TaxID=382 RepID=UPI000FDC816B|nr:hypothetical protein [Sinorhizobium meliloti]RVH69172.1 hypothetical protein CN198_13985 [Sinorhizobium meliloti]
MSMAQSQIPSLVTLIAFSLVGTPLNALGEEGPCLQAVELGVKKTVWEHIAIYFGTLLPGGEPSLPRPPVSRSHLTQLRREIVRFESVKENLIEIIEAHINTGASGTPVSEDLRLSKIPDALARMGSIASRLNSIAEEGDLFSAQDAFKELLINVEVKRADSLCRLAQAAASPTPDIPTMGKLIQELKHELQAISTAEEALAEYLREGNQ